MAGNGKIKGITIEFSADASGLTKALKEADSAARKSEGALRDINKALKFNPNSTKLLKQKQDELKRAIDATSKELEAFKQEQAAMDAAGVDGSSVEYQKLERTIMSCEGKLKAYGKELDQVNAKLSTLGQVGGKLQDVGGKLTSLGNSLKQVSMAAGAVVAAIGAVAYKSAVAADDINTLSKVTGISTAKLQVYAQASELVDVSVSAIAKSTARLKKNMLSASRGTGDAAKAFDALGVSVTDSNGNLRDQDDVFTEVLGKLGKMKNETERDALAMSIFGKSAAELNPLIEDCGETYQNLLDTFAENDIEIVDQKTLDAANDFNDSIDMIKATWSQAVMVIGTKLAGYLAPAMEKVQQAFSKVAGVVANMNPKVLAIIGAIAGIVAAAAPLLLIGGRLMTGIGGALTSIAGLVTKLGGLSGIIGAITGPIGIAIAAFAVLYATSEEFRNAINDLVSTLVDSLAPVFEALMPAFQAIIQVITSLAQVIGPILVPIIKLVGAQIKAVAPYLTAFAEGVASAFERVANRITSFVAPIQKAINKIKAIIKKCKLDFPKVKLPHFTVKGGKAPWGFGGKGKMPSVSVKWYKKGGIFNDPSVIGVGEAGPEAVLPIDKLQGMLDAASEKSAATLVSALSTVMRAQSLGSATNQPIVIQLGGTKVAETIFRLNKQGQLIVQG